MTSLNSLPEIVTKAGAYLLRCGLRADVYAILPQVGEGTCEFRVKGNITYPPNCKERRNRVRSVSKFSIWHVSGRMFPIHESPLDIVAEYVEKDVEKQ